MGRENIKLHDHIKLIKMPLRENAYGSECPLGKFKAEPHGGYSADPVEACLECNFADLSKDIDTTCQCPSDLTQDEYRELKKNYLSQTPENERSKQGFWEFVKNNYQL